MRLTTTIKSYHHELNAPAFEIFSSEKSSLQISDVRSDEFRITFNSSRGEPDAAFIDRANDIICYYLVALNAATLGHFSWDFKFVSPISYLHSPESGKGEDTLFFQTPSTYKFDEEKLQITSTLIWRSLRIMLALGEERNSPLVREYIKGLYNLHQTFLGLTFVNEAFANFYKAFEYFCTVYYLKKKKLDNEKKELKSVLRDFGFKEEIINDFDPIYVARCSEIMHAQQGLKSVDIDHVIKLKVFLDSLLHKHYEPIFNSGETIPQGTSG